MALYGGFAADKHLEELDTPLVTQEGVLTPATRKARVLTNLGITNEGWDPDFDDVALDTLTVEESIRNSIATVAAAGSSKTDAALMILDVNQVTAADGTKGVQLPAVVAGRLVAVINTVKTSDLLVYPLNTDAAKINAGTVDAAIRVGGGQTAVFYCYDATNWYVNPLSIVRTGTLAAAGSSKTDTAAIVTDVVNVTAADETKGVSLPTVVVGSKVTVINTVQTAGLLVYPANADDAAINGGTTDAAVIVPADSTATFYCYSATAWFVDLSQLASTHETVAISAGSTPLAVKFIAGVYAVSNDSDANDIVDLPTATAADVGRKIHFRSIEAFEVQCSEANALINKVDASGGNEAAVAAGDVFTCEVIGAASWLMLGTTELGAVKTYLAD